MSNFLSKNFGRLFTGKERRRAETLEYLRENIQKALQDDIEHVMLVDIPNAVEQNIHKIVKEEELEEVVQACIPGLLEGDIQDVVQSGIRNKAVQLQIQKGIQDNIQHLIQKSIQENVQRLIQKTVLTESKKEHAEGENAEKLEKKENSNNIRASIQESIQASLQGIVDDSIHVIAEGNIEEVARLDFMDNGYVLDDFKISYSQDINTKMVYKAHPSTVIKLTFNDAPDININQWMLDTSLRRDGVIRIFPYKDKVNESAKFTLTFNDAYCVGYNKKINARTGDIITSLTISPKTIKIGHEEMGKNWKEGESLTNTITSK